MCRNVLRSDAGLLTFPLLALLAGAIALGSSPILVRLSELEPTATAFYRVALAAPAFLLFSFAPREAPSLAAYSKAQWVGLFWLSAAGDFFALDLFCLHWSLRRTSVVNATLFLNFAPILVSLAAWALFGELPTRRAVVSYVIAIGGVALLLGEVATVARGRLVGDLLGLAAGAAYGGYLLVVSRFRYKMPTSLIMGVTTLSCACFILPATLAMGESLVPRTVTGWGTLLALALLTHAGGAGASGICDEIFSRLHFLGDLAAAATGGRMRRVDSVRRDAGALADARRRGCIVWDPALSRCEHARGSHRSNPAQRARRRYMICCRLETWRHYPEPNDVMPGYLKSGHCRAGEILVGAKTHLRLRSGRPSPSSACRAHRQDTR